MSRRRNRQKTIAKSITKIRLEFGITNTALKIKGRKKISRLASTEVKIVGTEMERSEFIKW
jgi:hypothetical protein